MAIEWYPKTAYFLIIEAFSTKLGSYSNTEWGDLSICQLRIYNRSNQDYDYRIRLTLSGYEGGPVIHASEWFTFTRKVTGQVGDYWLGDIVIDWPEYKMPDGTRYYISMETLNYNPDGLNTYMGVWADWMQPVYATDSAAARIAIGVKR